MFVDTAGAHSGSRDSPHRRRPAAVPEHHLVQRCMRVCAVLAFAVVARPAAAEDAFEIQVYDANTAPPGEAGIELHLNYHVIDRAPDEIHVTFEPHYGILEWAEVGGYLQTATTTTGDVAYAGVKLRL